MIPWLSSSYNLHLYHHNSFSACRVSNMYKKYVNHVPSLLHHLFKHHPVHRHDEPCSIFVVFSSFQQQQQPSIVLYPPPLPLTCCVTLYCWPLVHILISHWHQLDHFFVFWSPTEDFSPALKGKSSGGPFKSFCYWILFIFLFPLSFIYSKS